MKLNIKVVTKGSSSKPAGHQCPWIMDVPPEASRQA